MLSSLLGAAWECYLLTWQWGLLLLLTVLLLLWCFLFCLLSCLLSAVVCWVVCAHTHIHLCVHSIELSGVGVSTGPINISLKDLQAGR